MDTQPGDCKPRDYESRYQVLLGGVKNVLEGSGNWWVVAAHMKW